MLHTADACYTLAAAALCLLETPPHAHCFDVKTLEPLILQQHDLDAILHHVSGFHTSNQLPEDLENTDCSATVPETLHTDLFTTGTVTDGDLYGEKIHKFNFGPVYGFKAYLLMFVAQFYKKSDLDELEQEYLSYCVWWPRWAQKYASRRVQKIK